MLSSFVKRNSRQRIECCSEPQNERVSILLPVLNEAERIERCLDGLMLQPNEVSEILVIDGGSTDERNGSFSVISEAIRESGG